MNNDLMTGIASCKNLVKEMNAARRKGDFQKTDALTEQIEENLAEITEKITEISSGDSVTLEKACILDSYSALITYFDMSREL